MSDFSIIIQGPQYADSNSLMAARHYASMVGVDNVMVSHWYNDEVSQWQSLGIRMIPNDVPDLTEWDNMQHVACQAITTLAGLTAATTRFALKVRSDEFYSDLSPIMDAIASDPDKYVTSNQHCRRLREMKFHPSDHVIGGDRIKLIDAMCLLLERCQANDCVYKNGVPKRGRFLSPEQKLFTAWLDAQEIDRSDAYETTKRYLDIVDVRQLGSDFVWHEGPTDFDIDDLHTAESCYCRCIEDVLGKPPNKQKAKTAPARIVKADFGNWTLAD
jgi:hypothetical protein